MTASVMSLTGQPCPEFHVKVLCSDDHEKNPSWVRTPFSSLVKGRPAVMHFFNAG